MEAPAGQHRMHDLVHITNDLTACSQVVTAASSFTSTAQCWCCHGPHSKLCSNLQASSTSSTHAPLTNQPLPLHMHDGTQPQCAGTVQPYSHVLSYLGRQQLDLEHTLLNHTGQPAEGIFIIRQTCQPTSAQHTLQLHQLIQLATTTAGYLWQSQAT
jgi:hypothetical protein